ncbi:protein-L-isoaspartate O-methyltransferase [Blastomonas sp.]|uniref:protein-L-isoaspartate O-methyltransferase family protein n=1 Tax=Blastomonas sp. TaxID=1909299 RepID=UPI0035937A0C
MTATTTLSPPDFAAARRRMIESQLRPSAVSDPVVIAAMAVTQREAFVPQAQAPLAYIDRSVPLGDGRVLNPALSTGLMLTRAELRSDDKVLLVGAGTGYVAALLGGVVASVTAVEDNRLLVDHARTALGGIANVALIESPLTGGHANAAPYDLIIIDGAVDAVPPALIDQLADGGRLITGVNDNGVTRLAMGRKSATAFALLPFADTDIAPLAAFARPKGYSF